MGQKELELCQLYANNGSVPPVDAAECALMQNGELRTAAAKTEACRGEGEPPHHASVGQGRADRAAGRHARDDELAACKAELAASVNAHAALQYTLATYCAEIEEVACSLALLHMYAEASLFLGTRAESCVRRSCASQFLLSWWMCVKSSQIRSLCEKHGVNVRAGRNDPVPQRPWDVKKEGECSEEKNEVLRVANAEIEELRCKVMRLEAIVRSLACAVGVEQHARAEDEKLRKRLHEELQAEQSARTAAECACHVSLRAQLLPSCLCWSASIPACFPGS
jgi:hypothetical protein